MELTDQKKKQGELQNKNQKKLIKFSPCSLTGGSCIQDKCEELQIEINKLKTVIFVAIIINFTGIQHPGKNTFLELKSLWKEIFKCK